MSEVRLKFIPNFRLLAFGGLFFPVLISLGVWQLHRATEKERLQQAFSDRVAEQPQQYQTLVSRYQSDLDYYRVALHGEYQIANQWLLENQVINGKTGFHILTVFKTEAGHYFLVNRGWVAANASRQNLPAVETPTGNVVITALLKTNIEHPLLNYVPEIIQQQSVIATIDLLSMSEEVGYPLEPWVAYTDTESPGSYIVNWPSINVSADKHMGYAVQWFSMAFALFILLVVSNTNIGPWWRCRKRG